MCRLRGCRHSYSLSATQNTGVRVHAAHAPYTGAAAGVALALRAQSSWLPPSDDGGDGRAVLVLCVWHLFGPARYYLRGHCFPGRIRVDVFV